MVAPIVFDTVESYRKCRRPLGAGMYDVTYLFGTFFSVANLGASQVQFAVLRSRSQYAFIVLIQRNLNSQAHGCNVKRKGLNVIMIRAG